ncbi:hypothetical protein MCHUDSM44219_05322 [Mycolicibacterium chubuense]|uniref:Uncharacterized protein n=1 Tax=Mycolicibacterium chubuense TaxID=1800 RepID=A0A0J6VJ51_MYCCU|nr:hypothetical protein MCHUDSM44219_05322 [Mycolicibacterium chubuense]
MTAGAALRKRSLRRRLLGGAGSRSSAQKASPAGAHASAAPRASANWASAGENTGTASASSSTGTSPSRSSTDPTSTSASGSQSARVNTALNQPIRSSSVTTVLLTAVWTAPSSGVTTSAMSWPGSTTHTAVVW